MSAERKAGMIMGWARHATRTIGRLALLLVPALSSASAEPADNLWTAERKLAVTRIEVPHEGRGPSVGSGFVVKGMGDDRYFILTSTHVVLPEYDAAQALPSGPLPLLNGTRLFQGNSGGAELRPRCVYHLGSDTSLVELEARDGGYPALVPSARDIAVNDVLSLAGFPLGYPRDIRSGKVTPTSGPDGAIVTDILTAEGMSGGPYLAPDGMAVGIHRGGGRYTAGFDHMTPIWRLRTSLEKFLPRIPDNPPLPPSRTEAGAEAAHQCINARLEELRSQQEPFTYRDRITCGPGQKSRIKYVAYDVREKRPGYAIAGFVSHQDTVRNGWVGMLRYSVLDGLNTLAVEVPLECDVSNLAGTEEGFAEIEFSGYLRRIENKEAHDAIERACAARGR